MSAARNDIDEGYIKYTSHWTDGPPPDADAVALLNQWRQPLFAAGLIGHDARHNVGFGNLSVRAKHGGLFIISGTQTGHIDVTTAEHYALVTAVDIDLNSVESTGPLQASSEAMTHAALYMLSPDINAVVHVHSAELWQRHLDVLPTSDPSVAYGTPEMAREFRRLWHKTSFATEHIAVMAGHADGLVSVDVTLERAAQRLLHLHVGG